MIDNKLISYFIKNHTMISSIKEKIMNDDVVIE